MERYTHLGREQTTRRSPMIHVDLTFVDVLFNLRMEYYELLRLIGGKVITAMVDKHML